MALKAKYRAALNKANRNLPIEIESIILSKLQVKTLIRFRSVCHSWYSLISDSYFVNIHRLQNQNQNQNQNLLLVHTSGDKFVIADTYSNERSFFEEPYRYDYELVDSCNGLVCVYGQDILNSGGDECDMEYISLWNPALRINKTIRHCRMNMDRDDIQLCVGFGYHKQSNDYKVIRFANDLMTFRVKEVEIYSLSSDSWRKINGAVDSLINYYISFEFGVYVSDSSFIPNFCGAYCWIGWLGGEADGEDEHKIISFDMGGEVFKEIMIPPIVSQRKMNIGDLWLFYIKESLVMIDVVERPFIRDSLLFNVWVMKEYGEPKSWTKLFKFEQSPWFDISVFGITLETELDFEGHYYEIDVLDADKLQIKSSSTKDISILKKARRVISFTESLVLLDANN